MKAKEIGKKILKALEYGAVWLLTVITVPLALVTYTLVFLIELLQND